MENHLILGEIVPFNSCILYVLPAVAFMSTGSGGDGTGIDLLAIVNLNKLPVVSHGSCFLTCKVKMIIHGI